jgi:hypothetical protein
LSNASNPQVQAFRNVSADVAYQFAAMPEMARAMAAEMNVDSYDEARVRAMFGEEAAQAWRAVADARRAFYQAAKGEG